MKITIRKTESQQNYVVIYRFDSFEHANAWEESDERKDWVGHLSGLVEGEAETKRVNGLEFWFELPAVPIAAVAARYKMAILLVFVVYILVLSLNTIFAPLISNFPFYIKLLARILRQMVR